MQKSWGTCFEVRALAPLEEAKLLIALFAKEAYPGRTAKLVPHERADRTRTETVLSSVRERRIAGSIAYSHQKAR
jgi:hypothetical protein